MIDTSVGVDIPEEMVCHYFEHLVGGLFKILPIRESGEKSLPVYLRSLQIEILGCKGLISELGNDPRFISLTSILNYLRENPYIEVREVKREVFKAIDICNKMKDKYSQGTV